MNQQMQTIKEDEVTREAHNTTIISDQLHRLGASNYTTGKTIIIQKAKNFNSLRSYIQTHQDHKKGEQIYKN